MKAKLILLFILYSSICIGQINKIYNITSNELLSRIYHWKQTYPMVIQETDVLKGSCIYLATRNITKVDDSNFTVADASDLSLGRTIIIKTSITNYYSAIITNIVSTTITIDRAITEGFTSMAGSLWSSGDGLHLSEYAYRAIGNYMATTTNKHAVRKNNILNGNMYLGKYIGSGNSEPRVFYASDNSLFLNFAYLPGSTYGSNYYARFLGTTTGYVIQTTTNQVGYGAELPLGTIKAGGFIELQATGSGIYINPTWYYGEYTINLTDMSNNVLQSVVVNRFTSARNTYFDISTTGAYKLRFINNLATASLLTITNIQVFNSSGNGDLIVKPHKKIEIIGDSWTQRIIATPYTTHPDGTTTSGQSTMFTEWGSRISSYYPNILHCGTPGTTSEWGKYWFSYFLTFKPDYMVFHFGVNDYNSIANYPSTHSAYDIDVNNKWGLVNGGLIGSVNYARFVSNMQYMINTCISNHIIPIIMVKNQQSQEGNMWGTVISVGKNGY